MEPELEFSQSQSQRPAAPAPEEINTNQEQSKSPEALDLSAEKVLAKELAAQSASKGPKPQSKTYKHPMVIDLLLAVGLLFAMAAMTVSFVRTYITHSAKTSILQGNYKAAIGILHGSPIPEFFGGAGTDSSEDLLNQALYLDAMEKLDNNRDDQTALQELAKVSQGSFYYELAQEQFRKIKQQNVDRQPQGALPQEKSPPERSVQERSVQERSMPDRSPAEKTSPDKAGQAAPDTVSVTADKAAPKTEE